MGKRHRYGECASRLRVSVEGLAAPFASRGRAYSFPHSRLNNTGKMDLQLNANVENQDRAKCGKNDPSGMKSSGRRRKQVSNRTADDRSDDAERDGPKNRHVHVQHRFRDEPRD